MGPSARGKILAACVALGIGVDTAACRTPTSVTNVWSATVPPSGPLTKVLVFVSGVHETSRHSLEDALATQLSARGVIARTSYGTFGERMPRRGDAEQALKNAGFDGVLVAALRRHVYMPDVHESGFWDYLESKDPWTPPSAGWPYYAQFDEILDFETTLWNSNDGKLLWSAMTETRNPESGGELVTSVAKTVVSAIEGHRLIPRKR
jgi:hypothetical protein